MNSRAAFYGAVVVLYLLFFIFKKCNNIRKDASKSLETIWEIRDRGKFFSELKEYIWEKVDKSGVDCLSRPEKTIYFFDLFETEISNKGFYKFLMHTDSEIFISIYEAIYELKARELKNIFLSALSLFEYKYPPKELETRQKIMKSWKWKKRNYLNMLDNRFYKIDTVDLQYRYIMANKDEIMGNPLTGLN